MRQSLQHPLNNAYRLNSGFEVLDERVFKKTVVIFI